MGQNKAHIFLSFKGIYSTIKQYKKNYYKSIILDVCFFSICSYVNKTFKKVPQDSLCNILKEEIS